LNISVIRYLKFYVPRSHWQRE